ncbi:MAG TPA: precorrin-6y C5,15-methyltransferase (decarboxylating) subunit CbiE [Streptosporangiaceae bacterium]|nr:precorrin-6y C5,15-methyltransferase (decarboxylating) subunit CbiE [Streptosporangiaceae bacterium]
MITVVGMDGSALSPQAQATLSKATLVVGGYRHLAGVALPAGAATVAVGAIGPALDSLASHTGDAVVLASGDPGFFGVVRALRERGLTYQVHPAVSSVAMAFARAGLPWDDAMVTSAHGRDLRPALNVCRAFPKVAVFTGPGAGPAEVGAGLAGWDRRLVVCEWLGSPRERVTECSPQDAATRRWADPNLVLVLADADTAGAAGWLWPRPPAGEGWALPEDEFGSEGAVLTKAEVRALALARLAPGPGMLVTDVGAGAGTVAVECARLGAAVIAVERDAARCELIRANAARHGVDVRVVSGEAPAALEKLPGPNAAFVGGGGTGVLQAVTALRPRRVVTALAAVERAGQAIAALTDAGYTTDGAMVYAARLAPLPGAVHRLNGTNPVFLVWGRLP